VFVCVFLCVCFSIHSLSAQVMCVAVSCSMVNNISMCYSVFECIAVCCNVLHCAPHHLTPKVMCVQKGPIYIYKRCLYMCIRDLYGMVLPFLLWA